MWPAYADALADRPSHLASCGSVQPDLMAKDAKVWRKAWPAYANALADKPGIDFSMPSRDRISPTALATFGPAASRMAFRKD